MRHYGKAPRVKCKACGRDVAALRGTRGGVHVPRSHQCPHGRACGMQACEKCKTTDAAHVAKTALDQLGSEVARDFERTVIMEDIPILDDDAEPKKET